MKDVQKLSILTKPELVNICKRNNLSVTGEKQALAARILRKVGKIFDDEESCKRSGTSDPASEPASKRARVEETSEDGDNCVQIPDAAEQRLKKIVRKMTRKQLEEMMMTKMTEVITNKSEVGQLRKEVDSYKVKTEKWQSRAQALSKQLTDLGTVMKKYITDTKTRPRDKVSTVHLCSKRYTQYSTHA